MFALVAFATCLSSPFSSAARKPSRSQGTSAIAPEGYPTWALQESNDATPVCLTDLFVFSKKHYMLRKFLNTGEERKPPHPVYRGYDKVDTRFPPAAPPARHFEAQVQVPSTAAVLIVQQQPAWPYACLLPRHPLATRGPTPRQVMHEKL